MIRIESDLVVVGAGPAGLCAARAASEAGLHTIVLERSREIGSPVHTSGATWIPDVKDFDLPDRYIHPVTKISFVSNNSRALFETDTRSIGVLDVRGTYQYLAHLATEAGASIMIATSAKEVIQDKDLVVGVRAKGPDGPLEVRARVSIDASGLWTVLARSAGLRPAVRRFALGVELDLFAPHWDQNEFLLVVGSDLAPSGYGWIFPWGSGRVRAGVGVTKPDVEEDPAPFLRRLVMEDPRFAPRLAPHSEIEFHRGLFPAEGVLDNAACNGLLVVGDAAGHASLLVGEGIRFCMMAGRIAGEGVAKVLSKGAPTAARLRSVMRPWHRRFGRNFTLAHEANLRMTGFSDKTWDDTVSALARLSPRQFLQFLKTDFTLPLMTGMLARNPSLIKRKTFKKIFSGLT